MGVNGQPAGSQRFLVTRGLVQDLELQESADLRARLYRCLKDCHLLANSGTPEAGPIMKTLRLAC